MRTIETKEVAIMVRGHLKRLYPNTKFSVRSTFNSIRVSYSDGPSLVIIEDLVRKYCGSSFDGMIDLSHSYTSWLHENQLVPANSKGTLGSLGSDAGFSYPKPHPNAEEVYSGCSYVSVSRSTSRTFVEAVSDAFQKAFGHRPVIEGSQENAYFDFRGVLSDYGDCLNYMRIFRAMLNGTSEGMAQ